MNYKVMKKLVHNGILVLPAHKAKGYFIFFSSTAGTLSPRLLNDKEEEMALHWVKKLGTPYAEDSVFRKNFFEDFCKVLGVDYTEEINFDQLIRAVQAEKDAKEKLTKEEKKSQVLARKALRENRKKLYGYAKIDGHEIEVANYLAEPSCIFMGRGQHPLRGRWKQGPREGDITLNLSPNAPRPKGQWKKIVWEPKKMYVAKWEDKLSGKTKYVWLSDSWGKKQLKEKAKFDKAIELGKNKDEVDALIIDGMQPDKEDKERKVAAVCYLIMRTNMRVGDEKDPDEADTVGAITLRPEHVNIDSNHYGRKRVCHSIALDFLGKDSVHWIVGIYDADSNFVQILKKNAVKGHAYFEGITSKDVANFLQKVQKGLTAKVFRTHTATKKMEWSLRYSKDGEVWKNPELHTKKWLKMKIKMDVLTASQICNHKKAKPKNFTTSLLKKEEKVERCQEKLNQFVEEHPLGDVKKLKKLNLAVLQAKLERLYYAETAEWNLNTTLKSYIDPRVVRKACDQIGLPYEEIYSKALMQKFSWALK